MSANTKFETKTYNGISIVVDTESGYVNATRMCSDNNKRWRKYKETKQWKEIVQVAHKYIKFDDLKGPAQKGRTPESWKFDINEGVNDFRGCYIHPKLVHFVAEYVNVDYAFKVAELMDSINDKVHEQLKAENKEDTPTNTQPIFNKQVQQFTQMSIEQQNQQCWGFRDSPYKLDSYEQDDLKRDIDFYNKAKETLSKAKEAVESWSSFVKQYFPNFQF